MSKIIKSLNEFLAWRGFGKDETYYWARCFYKYTDCGPWATFLVTETQAHTKEHPEQAARFEKRKGKAVLTNMDELKPDFVSFLGYDKHGLSKKERTWKKYNELVDAFIADEAKQKRTGREIEITWRDANSLVVYLPGYSEEMEPVYDEVYYEDVRRGDKRFQRKVDNENCAGIKFGSIVEGSEVCSGPFTHIFPFNTDDWDRDEKYMEEETAFYWRRDNATWYRVVTDDDTWVVANVWGDIEWEESYEGNPVPDDIKAAAEKAIENDWESEEEGSSFVRQTIPEEPGMWSTPKKDWKALALEVGGATIATFTNDDVL